MGPTVAVVLSLSLLLGACGSARAGVDEMLGRADALYWEARYYEALDAAVEAVDAYPRSSDARSLEGRVLFKVARFEEAREAFEDALRLDAENFWAHYGLGLYALAAGLPGDAARELGAAHALWPENELPCLMLARASEEQGLYDDALGWIENAADLLRKAGRTVPEALAAETARLELSTRRHPYEVGPAFDRTTVPLLGGEPAIEARLGGGPAVRLLIDTAAAQALVVRPEAVLRSASLPVAVLESPDPGDRTPGRLVLLDRVEVGDLVVRDVPCVVSDRLAAAEVDGVLGLPFLRRFVWSFDFPSETLTIVDPSMDPAWEFRRGGRFAEARMYPGGPLLVEVGLYGEIPAALTLDSASDALGLDHEFYEREVEPLIPLEWVREARQVESPHGVTSFVVFRLPSLEVGGVRARTDLEVRTYTLQDSRRWAGIAAPGVLGMGLFRDWVVDLDFPRALLTLRRPE
jgi:hypothetical protein